MVNSTKNISEVCLNAIPQFSNLLVAMERSRGIEILRKEGHAELKGFYYHDEKRTSVKSIVTQLVSISPSNRPTAFDLLQTVFTEANLEKTKGEEEIASLKDKITIQDEKLKKQSKVIKEQRNEIKRLKILLETHQTNQ